MATKVRRRQKRNSTRTVGKVVSKSQPVQRTWAGFFAAWREINPWKVAGIVALAVTVFWVYWPDLNGSWLWDDDYLIENNGLVHDPLGLWNIWLEPWMMIDFFPLTVSLQWALWQLWPGETMPYHIANVVLHIISCLLVWRLLDKLGVRLAWVGAAIFAVHPITVESVAWMAEIKNTLSMPPFLLALIAWIDFERTGRTRYYIASFALFVVAMLCKTSMVTFPVLTLLYAWYLRDRIGWIDIKRSIPFFIISFTFSIILIALLKHGVGEETIPLGGIASRLACAGLCIAFYFSKCILPVTLVPLYPQWPVNPPSPVQFLPWVVMAFMLYYLWTKRTRFGKAALLGFGFFLISIGPFTGFRAISFMRFGWTMDHILYIPILGLICLAAAAISDLDRKLGNSWRPALWAVVALVLATFTVNSRHYAGTYVDAVALWSASLDEYPEGWVAHNNLGNALSDRGHKYEAEAQYLEALRINPGYPEAHNNLGIIYYNNGQIDAAITEFREALKYCPDLEMTQINLARLLQEQQGARSQATPGFEPGPPPGQGP